MKIHESSVYNYNLVCRLICSACCDDENDDSQDFSAGRVKIKFFLLIKTLGGRVGGGSSKSQRTQGWHAVAVGR
jgi:hypothetical protein